MVLVGLLLTAAAVGCRPKTRDETPEIPVVPVSHPVERTVTDYVDFTGRTDAVQSVNIIARVTGYLKKMPFKEGAEVKAGDLLFEIDPRPYQAQYDQAKSQVDLDQAQLELARTTLDRYVALSKTTPGAVSEQALDQYKASVTEAQARVVAQMKSLDVYSLNKEFTRVVSPIDGQVSRYYLTLGNLVNQDQTLLTTVVSLDPMYVYFDMDESTLLKIRTAIAEGKIAPPADGDLPVMLGLQNEDGFPHKATIDFVNNQVNSTTGSITMRGVFANPRLIPEVKVSGTAEAATADGAQKVPVADGPGKPEARGANGTLTKPRSVPVSATKEPRANAAAPSVANTARFVPRLFSPGMFVRVRLPIGQPHQALLIIDRAIQSDQGLKYVYVLDAQNKVQMRSIKTGPLQQDGLRVVEREIKPDDWVVVGAIQQVRSQMEVKPDQRPMPSIGGQSEAAPQAAGAAKGSAK
ncbi:MAG: efflux RND transporter periplasmic adaptor subunit [Thermoguttaceae bacterium]